MLMVAPAVEGIDLFKIAGRSISGWIPSLKTGSTVRQPFYSQLEERLKGLFSMWTLCRNRHNVHMLNTPPLTQESSYQRPHRSLFLIPDYESHFEETDRTYSKRNA